MQLSCTPSGARHDFIQNQVNQSVMGRDCAEIRGEVTGATKSDGYREVKAKVKQKNVGCRETFQNRRI